MRRNGIEAARNFRFGSKAGMTTALRERLLYPRIADKVVALPRYSALCQKQP
jgi:hypothetical protein